MSNQDTARRSTAVQFFMEDEAEESSSSYNQVVEWLNKAAISVDATVRTDMLRKVQEIIINKEESLLDNFLDEVLNFQTDRDGDVRKFVVGFIEEACKRDPEVLPKVVVNLSILLQDESAQVQKKVVQVFAQVYQTALAWLSRAKAVTDNMEAAWGVVSGIKAQIVNLIDSDNDGIRTHAVKFLERVVLLQTYPEPDSMQRENDFTLEDVPMTLKIARRRKLEEEALMVFELLLNFHGSQHISSINLMTCMGSLTLIAKMRPSIFMGKVVTAFEKLHINLPPTLSKSQVSSVRKHLKIQLLNLLKHPSAVDYHTNITTLLTDLGATHQEIVRSFPKLEDLRRRQKRIANAPGPGPHMATLSKKPRMEVEEEEDASDDDEGGDLKLKRKAPGGSPDSAIDVTEQFVFERLTPDVTAQLVMLSMIKLPDSMPAHFSATYTPIAAAGTPSQIRHVARLMAAQLTTLGLGPGARQVKKLKIEEEDDEDASQHSKASISSAISGIIDKDKDMRVVAKTSLQPSGGITKVTKQKIKTLKLSEITKPLDEESQSNMMKAAVTRILRAERDAAMGGILTVRNKVLTILAATFKKDVRKVILEFLLEDLRNRIDLGFAWLYEEYSFMQGFNRLPPFLKQETSPDHSYNHLLCSLARSLMEKISYDGKDGSLLMRLYLEAPMITDEAVDILKAMCCEEAKAAVGLTLLQELVLRRPPRQLVFLNSLLVHTAHENNEVRTRAIRSVVALYNRGDLRSIVEEYAVLYLSFLRLPHPPDVLFGPERGRAKPEPVVEGDEELPGVTWTEEAVKACLYLYLALLPLNEKLIHELAKVYVQTVADVKRTILRLLEQPVRGMGMDSPQLLKLVEDCPKGAETLVTRLIHILTDKTPPSTELVARVRELYHTRVSDVRFLIPVLNGLTKKEVIAALPRLIKLNPVVVKEVFNRLLGTHSESVSHTSPLTPAELLIALHLIDPSKCELKTVIKATSLCFSEKQAYSQEVLAVVLQHLMDVSPLPTLLMRTVIQSLSLYPRLIGFVMNILQRLILKQVWKQKKVWEGFIKCCQRTKPQSFQVLLQLPPAQLSDVFESSPDLRQPLLNHVMAFTENQRAHIPQSIMDVLLGKKRTSEEDVDDSMEAQSPSDLTIDIKDELDEVPRIEPAPPGMD